MTNPLNLFSLLVGAILILSALAGITGISGVFSTLAFFNFPIWINVIHFGLGLMLIYSYLKLDTRMKLNMAKFIMVAGLLVGVSGLLFREFLSNWFLWNEADLSDDIARIALGSMAAITLFLHSKKGS